MKKDLLTMLAVGQALAIASDDALDYAAYRSTRNEQTEFAKQSDAFKALCWPRGFYPRSKRPYRRPIPKTDKGKKAVRAAKRVKVMAMKYLGHSRGDNRPFIWPPPQD